MKRLTSKADFALLCLAVGLVVFSLSFTMLGQAPGEDDTTPPPGNVGDDPEEGTNPTPGGPDDGEVGPVGVVTDGDRIIQAISSSGDDAVVKALLDEGADPNSLSSEGILPLEIAVVLGSESSTGYGLVKMLIENGANPNQIDPSGLSPMDAVAKHGTEAMMTALIEAGGDPHLPTQNLTPYKRALMHGNDGPLAAIKKAYPDHKPSDEEEWKRLSAAGEISKAFDEAVLLEGADRATRIEKLVNGFIASGMLPEKESEELIKQFMAQVAQMAKARR